VSTGTARPGRRLGAGGRGGVRWSTGRPGPRRIAAALLVPVLLTAAGCTGPAEPVPVASPEPLNVQRSAPSASASPVPDCEPRNSLTPSATRPEKYLAQGYLRAGVDQTMGRMTYRDPLTGEFKGFDIDILKEIARELFPDKDLSKSLRFVVLISGERQDRLNDGTVDIVADSMTATCRRAVEVAFSTDYLDSGQTVLVRANSPYQSISDLGGKPVCAAAGTTSIVHLRERPEGLIPVGVPNWTDCLVMLQQGQVEAISTDHNVLLGLRDLTSGPMPGSAGPTPSAVGSTPGADEPALNVAPKLDWATRIVTQPPRTAWSPQDPSCLWHDETPCTWFTDEPHAIAFRKDDTDLIRFVNYVLAEMRKDGRWQAIHDRWLWDHPDKGPPPARYDPSPTWPPGR
jgi:polar amino acid transport system substrate-binding protein